MALWRVGIDTGKANTKYCAGDNEGVLHMDMFSTKMVETTEVTPLMQQGHIINVNGISTLIGADGEHDGESTKKLDLHRRCAYQALALSVPNGSDVLIAIGCTLNQYKNSEDRNDYIRYILNMSDDDKRKPNKEDIEISFVMDGKDYSYNVKKIKPLPEASGYIILNEHLFQDEYDDIAILDFGGRNVNGAIYRRTHADPHLNIQLGKCFTIDEGANLYKEVLLQELNTRYQLGLQLDAMETALLNGYVRSNKNPKVKEESKAIISAKKTQLVNTVVQRMRNLKWSIDSTRFIFIGGGSLLFRREILDNEAFGSDLIISEPMDKRAVFYNVMGFAKATGLDITSKQLEEVLNTPQS